MLSLVSRQWSCCYLLNLVKHASHQSIFPHNMCTLCNHYVRQEFTYEAMIKDETEKRVGRDEATLSSFAPSSHATSTTCSISIYYYFFLFVSRRAFKVEETRTELTNRLNVLERRLEGKLPSSKSTAYPCKSRSL